METCLIASNHNLRNLVCIIDKNKSTDRAINIDDNKKFYPLGWNVVTVNGHNTKI